jgi:pectinesterase
MKYLLIILFVILNCNNIQAKENAGTVVEYDFIVAKDGSGDFVSIQEAIDAVPDYRREQTSIFVKRGSYKEKIVLAESKQNIFFVGEDPLQTIITYDDFASRQNRFGENIGTSGSAGFYIYGINIHFSKLTFENTAGPVGQAVAVLVAGDKIQFTDCRFIGYQDTLYTYGKQSRQYYLRCYIEGTVDFIFGSSTAVFDSCTIFGKTAGYFTAASTPQENVFGYVFLHCKITGNAPPGSFKLGRPWRPFAKTVFLYCDIDEIVTPKGWDNWGKTDNEKTVYYAEYKNRGNGSSVKERVSWANMLTEKEAALYTLENIFGDWKPARY